MLAPQHLLWIDGPAGRLHTIYLPPEAPERGVAVINHPNPLHGGTFTNKVIQTAAKVYARLGFHCYLPNLPPNSANPMPSYCSAPPWACMKCPPPKPPIRRILW